MDTWKWQTVKRSQPPIKQERHWFYGCDIHLSISSVRFMLDIISFLPLFQPRRRKHAWKLILITSHPSFYRAEQFQIAFTPIKALLTLPFSISWHEQFNRILWVVKINRNKFSFSIGDLNLSTSNFNLLAPPKITIWNWLSRFAF